MVGLAQKIEEIPDGTALARRTGNGAGWTAASRNEIKIDIMNPGKFVGSSL